MTANPLSDKIISSFLVIFFPYNFLSLDNSHHSNHNGSPSCVDGKLSLPFHAYPH